MDAEQFYQPWPSLKRRMLRIPMDLRKMHQKQGFHSEILICKSFNIPFSENIGKLSCSCILSGEVIILTSTWPTGICGHRDNFEYLLIPAFYQDQVETWEKNWEILEFSWAWLVRTMTFWWQFASINLSTHTDYRHPVYIILISLK